MRRGVASQRRWLCGLLVLLAGIASADPVLPERDARMAALAQYQHDLVSVLTLRADARHLLGAALLSRSFGNSAPGQRFNDLLERAARAEPDNAAITWARLGDCDAKAGDCPRAQALKQLQQQAPDNAAVWILRLDMAARDNDREGERQALHQAAAAARFDDYNGALLGALTAAATALPVPPDAMKAYAGTRAGQAGPASAQAFLAYGLASALPRPGFLPVVELCDPEYNDAAANLAKDCRKLAHALAWGTSAQGRAAGLHLQDVLATNAAEREAARQDMADLTWQVRQYSRLMLKALAQQDLAVQLLRLGQSGGSELTRMSALLRQNGIPVNAPKDTAPAAAATAIMPIPAPITPAPDTAHSAPPPPAAPASVAAAAASSPDPAGSVPAGAPPAPGFAEGW